MLTNASSSAKATAPRWATPLYFNLFPLRLTICMQNARKQLWGC